MADGAGWFKMHRKVCKWERWTQPLTAHLFVHLLANANWESKTWRGIELAAGDLIVGREALVTQTGLTASQVRTALEHLKITGEIAIKTTNKFSIISILKWNEYQEDRQQNDQQNSQQERSQIASGIATAKEDKKIRRKNIPPSPLQGVQHDLLPMEKQKLRRGRKPTTAEQSAFDQFWKHYPRKEGKDEAIQAYLNALDAGATADDLLRAVKAMCRRLDNDDRPRAEKLRYCKYAQGWLKSGRWKDYLTGDLDGDDDDDDEMPKNMTPEQHAKWCAKRLGLWPIP